MLKNQKVGLLILAVVMIVLLYFRFPDFFGHANSRVMEPWGDGYKAYMAIYNHAAHDSTYAHFEGMNYPYGEHAVPGATQPLISNSIKFISRNIADVTDYTIGVVNWSMLLGMLLCAVFCYLIFTRLELPPLYSALVAIGIAFLNPQMVRMGAHYGLAHPEVMPVIFYLLLRYEQSRSWKWSLAVAMAVWCFSLIHFYYFAIMGMTIGGYFGFSTLRDKSFSIKLILKNLKQFAIQLILPLLFFIYWIFWNDPVDDRCEEPWGFIYYHAELEGIFTSMAQPFFQGHGIKEWSIENNAYLGLVAIITGTILVVIFLKNLLVKAPVNTGSKNDFFLNNLFFTSVVILIFSFGLPFTIDRFEYWLEYVKFIQQFRSVGRFAWAPFYAFNIIAFYWLYKKAGRRKWWLVLPVALLIYEAWNHTHQYNLKLDEIEEYQEGKSFANIQEINYEDYQSVIPIPFYNIGSDNFWIHIKGYIGQKSQTLSMQTGLPLNAAMLTRSSMHQTIKQIQLVTEPYRFPELLNDLEDDRPFLLMWDATRAREFSPKYDHLKEGLEMVYQKYPLQFYSLPLDSFEQRITAREDWLQATIGSDTLNILPDSLKSISSYDSNVQFLSPDTIDYLYYSSLDTLSAEKNYKGDGGYQGKMGDLNTIFDQKMAPGKYTFTAWMYIQEDLYPRTDIILEEYDAVSGQSIKKHMRGAHDMVAVIGQNGWGLLEWPMEVTGLNSKFRVIFHHAKVRFSDKPIFIDEVLIRQEGKNIYFNKNEWNIENNRWFEKN
jgi:hypothetical protein